ncbi:MAG: STAS/SEC14 domain-containing protein [Nitrospirota bacterium]
MPIQLKAEDNGKLIVFHISGVLTKEEYDRILPQVESLLRPQGAWRVLCEMTDFHGWEPSALWEELKFDWAHRSDLSRIDRCAMVGDQKWESIMATLSKPFTSAAIRYFDHMDLAGARKWLDESPSVVNQGKTAR